MKKLIALLLAVAMLLSLTACGGTAKSEATNSTTETRIEPVETEPVETEPAETEPAPTETATSPTNP